LERDDDEEMGHGLNDGCRIEEEKVLMDFCGVSLGIWRN